MEQRLKRHGETIDWLQAGNANDPKHTNWPHPVFSFAAGATLTIYCGYQVVPYMDLKPFDNYQAHFYYGHLLSVYMTLLVVSRLLVGGPKELYYQLWACNIGIYTAIVGIFTGHRIIVAAACAAVSPDQVFWYVDVLARIITGKYPIGVAKYVEKKETHLVHRLTAIHHLCFMPICIHYIRSTGKGDWPPHAFLSVFIAVSVLSVWTRVFVPRFIGKKELNINMSYRFWSDIPIKTLHTLNGKTAHIYVPFIILFYMSLVAVFYPLFLFSAKV